jgi:hypothetical protein
MVVVGPTGPDAVHRDASRVTLMGPPIMTSPRAAIATEGARFEVPSLSVSLTPVNLKEPERRPRPPRQNAHPRPGARARRCRCQCASSSAFKLRRPGPPAGSPAGLPQQRPHLGPAGAVHARNAPGPWPGGHPSQTQAVRPAARVLPLSEPGGTVAVA